MSTGLDGAPRSGGGPGSEFVAQTDAAAIADLQYRLSHALNADRLANNRANDLYEELVQVKHELASAKSVFALARRKAIEEISGWRL